MDQKLNQYATVPNHLWELWDVSQSEHFYIERHRNHDATTALHTHNFVQIYYVHKGFMQHTVFDIQGNKTFTSVLTSGELFILPPWVYHQVSFSNDILYTSICFNPRFVHFDFRRHFYFCSFISHILSSTVVNTDMYPKSRISFKTEQGEVSTLIHAMEDEYARKKEGYLTYIKGDLLKLLVIIARQYSEKQPSSTEEYTRDYYYEPISRSIAFVNENFQMDLKINEVSKKFSISRTYFCILFKRITGYTFYEYMNSLRLNHAKTLMLSSDLTITEIAHISGFNDISNYCRRFKKAFGMSPTNFKKTHRKSE